MSKELIEELREAIFSYDEWAREKCVEAKAIGRIKELERELFNTEADRQLQLELKTTYMRELNEVEAERDDLRVTYHSACKAVSEMHAAAMGAAVGPVRGVVEDVADLKAERDSFYMDYRMKCDEETKALQADNARLREALELIAGTDPLEAALDPQRAVRVARNALAATKEPE